MKCTQPIGQHTSFTFTNIQTFLYSTTMFFVCKIIYEHQNPPDCSKVEYMIVNGYPSGDVAAHSVKEWLKLWLFLSKSLLSVNILFNRYHTTTLHLIIIHVNYKPVIWFDLIFIYFILFYFIPGFGSMVHVESALLSLAMKLGRVYLRYLILLYESACVWC